jgi:hypothetical protein
MPTNFLSTEVGIEAENGGDIRRQRQSVADATPGT